MWDWTCWIRSIDGALLRHANANCSSFYRTKPESFSDHSVASSAVLPMVSINVPKRGIFTCDCKTTDEAIQFLKSKLLGAWMCVDMVSIESCRAGVQNGERERTLSSFSCLFLLLSSLALWVRHFKSSSIKHCTSSSWKHNLWVELINTQAPVLWKDVWLHGCLGQGCRSKPGTATCCCLAVHISWAPRSSWMNSMQNWFLGLVGLVDRS